MADETTCARHPDEVTRLRCAQCETAICPRCAVEAPIGLRCPDCARPDRGAGLRRRPDQVGRAAGVAVVGAVVGALVIGLVQALIQFGGLFAAWLVGLQIGQRVRAAASGNTVDVVRGLALTAAVAAPLLAPLVVVLVRGGTFGISPYGLLGAAIGGYGAWSAFR